MSKPGSPPTLSIPQMAEELRCSPSTLYAQIKAGTFDWPVVHVGTEPRVPRMAYLLRMSGVDSQLTAMRDEIGALHAEVAELRGMLSRVFALGREDRNAA